MISIFQFTILNFQYFRLSTFILPSTLYRRMLGQLSNAYVILNPPYNISIPLITTSLPSGKPSKTSIKELFILPTSTLVFLR